MTARPRAVFVHSKTVRLIVDEGMDLTAIEIIKSLPDFKEEIAGIVPNFGGKCFDITLKSTEAATRLATSGFDHGAERKKLKLLGAKTTHVSVFVAVEFPERGNPKNPQELWTLEVRHTKAPVLLGGGL